MREVTRHEVSGEQAARALDDIDRRTRQRWNALCDEDPSPQKLREMHDELMDHVAARSLEKGATFDELRGPHCGPRRSVPWAY